MGENSRCSTYDLIVSKRWKENQKNSFINGGKKIIDADQQYIVKSRSATQKTFL